LAEGGPGAGYFTKRTAEAWLRATLDEARRGVLPGLHRTGATFADAAAEWLPLATLGRREHWVADDDLVFVGGTGDYLDGSALRRRYKAALRSASLRPLRFHDLRHTFGTRMIAKADIRRVQEWMGHADIQTTMRYLHYAPHPEDAASVAEAFRSDAAAAEAAQRGTFCRTFWSQHTVRTV
jgi:hypothetical protein